MQEPVLPFYCDTQNQAFWDARIQKYVAYLRSWNPLRTVSRVEVEDITRPWPYDKTVKPFHLWGEKRLPALTTQLPIVLAYDERDPVVSDPYNPASSPIRMLRMSISHFPPPICTTMVCPMISAIPYRNWRWPRETMGFWTFNSWCVVTASTGCGRTESLSLASVFRVQGGRP